MQDFAKKLAEEKLRYPLPLRDFLEFNSALEPQFCFPIGFGHVRQSLEIVSETLTDIQRRKTTAKELRQRIAQIESFAARQSANITTACEQWRAVVDGRKVAAA